MFLSLLLVLLNIIVLSKICKDNNTQLFTKVVLCVSYFGWNAAPLLISYLPSFENAIHGISFDRYVYWANINQFFLLFTYTITFFLIKRKTVGRIFQNQDFQVNPIFINRVTKVSYVLLLYATIKALTSSANYLDGNNITMIDDTVGVISLFSDIGVYVIMADVLFLRSKFSKHVIILFIITLSIYYFVDILRGSRIKMFFFLISLIYYALEQKKKRLLVQTIIACFFALSLLPLMSVLRTEGRMNVSDISVTERGSSDDVLNEVLTKTNSVCYGAYLTEYGGVNSGGPLVYVSTLFSLVPRSIMPYKPQPGSKDGTMYGLPSRLSCIYSSEGAYNDIGNNGVSTSLEALWAMGWPAFIVQIFVSAFIIFLINSILRGRKILFLYMALAIMSFPICVLEISLVQFLIQIQRFFVIYVLCKLIFVSGRNSKS